MPRFMSSPKHRVQHFIKTQGPPVAARPRRLNCDKLRAAKAEFDKMERLGIIRRSDSPWSSPLHLVTKKDGSYRPCGDFRRLNVITEDDRYPLPHIHDFNANLAGATIFSVIDLVKGFHHMPINKDDIPKTAVITPFGLYEFLRMQFGLKNAAQSFQRMMEQILRGLDYVFIYLDDVLVASADMAQHESHLHTVFSLLQEHGMTCLLYTSDAADE